MCGINGIMSSHSVNQLERRIHSMNESIIHRGPDYGGFEILSSEVGLGHRRLAIIDLDSRSNQPMFSNSGETCIVFNGEIFNFLEIKEELKSNYTFKTESDTEVLLAGFELKGLDWLLKRMNGMFSIAFYQKAQNKLTLVRDRFGIKPLYYSISDQTLVFSSEIKGILHSGLVDAVFNESAVDDYLANRYVREPYTFFRNIFQVMSASYLEFKDGEILKTETYWELPKLNFEKNYNEQEILIETEKQLKKAFERWFISDVKVGTYLSGGVDSSLTTAFLSNYKKEEINTYTIGFDKEGYNEFEYARLVAEKYKTKHHEIELSQSDYEDQWVDLIKFKDAPLAVPNEIPLAIMSSALKKDITVVISGEGADELFGGYGRIYRLAFDFANHKTDQNFYDYFISEYEYVPRNLRDTYLNIDKEYRKEFDVEIESEFKKYCNEENIFRFFHTYHVKGLLNRVDMTTMQTAVEARPPFMDHELIEFVYTQIPYDLKLKWLTSEDEEKAKELFAKEYSEKLDSPKYILKEVARKYLPSEIIDRKKVGFPVPLTEWMPELKVKALNLLQNVNWLNEGVIEELLLDIEETDSPRTGQILWMFMNVELFRKEYFNKNWRW